MTRALILHHPHTRPEHWLYVEEDSTRRIASTLCLIPWRWNYAGIPIKSGELGICATSENFRNRGLVRALTHRHKELLHEGGFHFSHIQGIPYFYRQFGYEYALQLEGGTEIELHRLPHVPPPTHTFRRATVDDIPFLMRFHAAATRDLDISAARDADEWRFIIEHAPSTGTAVDGFVLLDSAGQPIGYWFVQLYGFGSGLNISECSPLSYADSAALLAHLKVMARERGKPYIRLIGRTDTPLIQAALSMGAVDRGSYQWQIHLPSVPRLLRAIAPVLESRLAASMFADLTQTITLNLYKEAFALRFESGRLSAIDPLGYREGGEMRIPPLLFPLLVLGWRTRQELADIYPDISFYGQSAPLIDALFPPMSAYLHTIY